MVGLTKFGYALCTAAIAGVVKTAVTLGAGGLANAQVLGFKLGDFTAALNFIGNFALIPLIPLMFAGLVFAFYVPFIPMITWYGGVLSWFIVVVEAVVAAPLWMLAHMEAEGEGMGQKTAHGYMFLLNLIFRPAIMVIGLVLGWYIMQVYGYLLKYMLGLFFGSGYGTSSALWHSLTGFFMFIACIVVFASLAMYTVGKAFSLIHVLPDQVFAWVGGHFKGFGGDEHQDSKVYAMGMARTGQAKASGVGKSALEKTVLESGAANSRGGGSGPPLMPEKESPY